MTQFRTNWRDCQEWSRSGLPLSTTSNQACKLYDAVLSQYVGVYEDQSLGGLAESTKKLLQADPSFVMGRALVCGLNLVGTSKAAHTDEALKANVGELVALARGSSVGEREKKHAEAIDLWAYGDMTGACRAWQDILVEHPTDMMALKFAHDSYFFLGRSAQMRDSVARVLPSWDPATPLYGYLLGMHSFGLVETNYYREAEKSARRGLELNSCDAWSTHSMAHVFEVGGRHDEGIRFMSSTLPNWSKCGLLAEHNFWHWSLYHLEKGEYSASLDIYDSETSNRMKSGSLLNITDAASMLFRLEMEGVNVGERWSELFEVCEPLFGDHILAFNDIHFLISSLGAGQTEATKKLMDSLKSFIADHSGTQVQVFKDVGTAVMEAFIAYDENDSKTAVEKLLPVRYKIVEIGGSNAQRDLFNLFLIHAALKSSSRNHHKLARQLLAERKCLKECSPMTDRLISKAIALHL